MIPSAVFADPEVAWVGPTAPEREARWHPGVLADIRVDLASTDRGLTDGVRHGFVSVSAVRLSGRVVAATVVGPPRLGAAAPADLGRLRDGSRS